MRDLYDLFWFGQGALNEARIRRLFILKVWNDVVRDGLGDPPLDPAEVVTELDVRRLPPEDIGLLTRPVDPTAWLQFVRQRYAFVVDLGIAEKRIARCSAGDSYFVQEMVKELSR